MQNPLSKFNPPPFKAFQGKSRCLYGLPNSFCPLLGQIGRCLRGPRDCNRRTAPLGAERPRKFARYEVAGIRPPTVASCKDAGSLPECETLPLKPFKVNQGAFMTSNLKMIGFRLRRIREDAMESTHRLVGEQPGNLQHRHGWNSPPGIAFETDPLGPGKLPPSKEFKVNQASRASSNSILVHYWDISSQAYSKITSVKP